MWFLFLISGFIIGATSTIGLLFYYVINTASGTESFKRGAHDAMLLTCRKRFGQIATRESIREVRKIAQQAIKELS